MSEDKKPSTRKVVDWDLMEPEYRAGQSLSALSGKYGCSEAAIVKHARKFGWTRDLTERIRQKAEAKVRAEAVRAEVRAANQPSDQEVVDANADVQFVIRMSHRADITRARKLFATLMGELEAVSDKEGQAMLEQLAEIVEAPREGESEESADRRRDRMQRLLAKILDGPARIDSAKKLAEMLEKLIRMEREAYSIDDKKGPTAADVDALYKAVNESAGA